MRELLNELILNSWERIPENIKKNINNLDFTIEKENNDIPEARATCQKYGSLNKITFYTKNIKKDIQTSVDRLLIHELAHYFSFDEKKACEMMEKKKL